MAILFISHDLAVVKHLADYICIMKDGKIVEQSSTDKIFSNPKHEYTKQLINIKKEKKKINSESNKNILEINNLKVWYPIKKGILKRTVDYVKAVDSVDFSLKENQTLGIVGESGSGKTSLVLALLKLINFNGKVIFNNTNISSIKNAYIKSLRKDMQIIFQDPFSSLSPRMTVEEIVSEGLNIHEKNLTKSEKNKLINDIMNEVGMDYKKIHDRFPHEFSGGQRQRIAIARALILKPKLLILDEPTSALDVSIQNQIIILLNKLQEKYKLSYIFISHDLNVIKAVADYVIVLKNGKIIEKNTSENIFNNPKDAYTKNLILSQI